LRDRLALARRELASLGREKTIVLAIAIQLFIAAFSSFLVVGLVTLYSPAAAGGAVTVDVGVSGNASDALVPAVESGGRDVTVFDSRRAALQSFRDREVDAVLDATRRPAGDLAVEAVAPEGDFRTTLVVVQLTDALDAVERQQRAALSSRLDTQPLDLPPDAGGNPYYGFTYTVLLPLLMFLPVFISGSITADSLTEEIERGTLELLRVAPLTPAGILDGKAVATATLAPAQAAAWLALLGLNGIRVADPLGILLLVSALSVLTVSVGAALALAVRERRGAQLLYSLGVLAAFGAAALLPENPANAVAKLAIGSATPATYAVVLAVALGCGAGYLALRRFVERAVRP
jgi:ABC-type Na+ efflux pump permease subunit